MNKEQIYKIFKVLLVATSIIFAFEVIFAFDFISTFFSNLILETEGILVYFIIWLIMFAQVTVLNIPAYVILSASISVGIDVFGVQYLVTVISAYMVGCVTAYWVGRLWGSKAVKWCAGNTEDFEKWVKIINTKGKWWYFGTILLPIFPDDLLCIVVGSVKFNFIGYCIFNLIGRSVGLICMLWFLTLFGAIGGGFPFMIIVWGIAILVETIILLILKNKCKNI